MTGPRSPRAISPASPRTTIGRRRRARARVELIDAPESGYAPDGSVMTRQSAQVTLPQTELERIWTPEYLERLARTYWRFLTRISLGLLRVLYTESSREIVLLGRPLVLLRFRRPEYEIQPDGGTVTWRIERGLLVAPPGRGKGHLRISVTRPWKAPRGGQATVYVSCEVASFYPMLAGLGRGGRLGWLSRLGRAAYRATQLQVHVLVTRAFLRSLARLDLVPSEVGALRPRPVAAEHAVEPAASRSARR